jgi:putative membrane protein
MSASNPDSTATAAILAIERPARKLLTYYSLSSALLLPIPPAALILWLVHYFRYNTLRYRFDSEGVSMRWGILFRREILLSYSRIQDIHLVSNFVERHLGLARIQIQTASGSATPEMTIEGLHEFEAVRDFLYSRMRGTRFPPAEADRGPEAVLPPIPPSTMTMPVGVGSVSTASHSSDLGPVLREIAAEVREIRRHLESKDAR